MRNHIDLLTPSVRKAAMGALVQELRPRTAGVSVHVYHGVWVGTGTVLVGVVGVGGAIGENGYFEWFIWDDHKCKLRLAGAGCWNSAQALCRGLVEAGARTVMDGDDWVLTWQRQIESGECARR